MFNRNAGTLACNKCAGTRALARKAVSYGVTYLEVKLFTPEEPALQARVPAFRRC